MMSIGTFLIGCSIVFSIIMFMLMIMLVGLLVYWMVLYVNYICKTDSFSINSSPKKHFYDEINSNDIDDVEPFDKDEIK